MISDYRLQITTLSEKFESYYKLVNPQKLKGEIDVLENCVSDENFWNDNDTAHRTVQKLNGIKRRLEPWDQFKTRLDDLITLFELADEAKASEYESEISTELSQLSDQMNKLELLELMSEENDNCNAILNIHPGAGGTEACDWADMLYRMYSRWSEKKKFSVEILDILDGEEAGIKNVTLLISGDYAYGLLKNESGIHRLVRISPFDSNARRHTSFASVFVSPDIEDSIEIEIKPEDLRVDTYRAGGAGGQHVNKTDSAVRFTHLPTNIVVQCQNERSQIKNRATAMKILKAKLYDHYKQIQDREREKESPEKKDISWGSQIRSYTFQPYTLVKDHRTKAESGNVQAVMDGDIDLFLDTALKEFSLKKR